jgi:hypothetical protein
MKKLTRIWAQRADIVLVEFLALATTDERLGVTGQGNKHQNCQRDTNFGHSFEASWIDGFITTGVSSVLNHWMKTFE